MLLKEKGYSIMKKKMVAALLVGMMILAAGCGNKGKIATLAEYKGLALTSVSQETIDEQLQGMLQNHAELLEVKRAAVEGDTVNINYVGTLDGVAFEGGTDASEAGTDLKLGSNSFIDGFEDGLIGAVAGEVRDLNLTFPEGYQNAELAGKAVVFTVTVNAVKETMIPDFTDEFVAENFDDYTTTAEYLTALEDALNNESYFTQATEQIMGGTEIKKYPEDEVLLEKQATIDYYNQYAQYYASMSGLDVNTALYYFFGIESQEALEEYAEEYAYQVVKQTMILQEIAKLEGIKVSDEQYAERGLELAISSGYTDLAALEENFEKDYIENFILMNLTMEFIIDNAVIVDAE